MIVAVVKEFAVEFDSAGATGADRKREHADNDGGRCKRTTGLLRVA